MLSVEEKKEDRKLHVWAVNILVCFIRERSATPFIILSNMQLPSREERGHRKRDSCTDAEQVCSASLLDIPFQGLEHALILLAKRGDDEGLGHFQQTLRYGS